MARIGPAPAVSSAARASVSGLVYRNGAGGSSSSLSRRAASITLCAAGPPARCVARRRLRRKRARPEPRRSTTRPQRWRRTSLHRSSQWRPRGRFSMRRVRARPGISANRGAVRALAAMVKRAPSISSVRARINPDERTASPIRLAAMNRIGKRCEAIGAPIGPCPLAPKLRRGHIAVMTAPAPPLASGAPLKSRAILALSGPDWRSFLQGLVTQDVETLTPGELRFAALLTPQGRLLFDLFLLGRDDTGQG